MKRRLKGVIGLVSVLLVASVGVLSLFGGGATASAEKKDTDWPKGPGNLSAASAIVLEMGTGVVLYEKNMHEKQYPASITKIMTALLCLENASLSDTVKFSERAVLSLEPGSSHISIDIGEKLKMEDCLYGIMLASANEACNGVAEHISGDIESFVKMMNQRAKELGCQNTHFHNPNGLFHEKHYTTAYDMSLIAREAMKNDVFRRITGTKQYVIPKTNKKKKRPIHNKHQMLYAMNYPQYGYEYTIGGKTGYTDLARWTLVTFAKKGDMELMCVVMRTAGPPPSEPNAYTDTIKLMNYGFENYKKHDFSQGANGEEGANASLFTNYNPLFSQEKSPIYAEGDTGVVLPDKAKPEDAEQTVEYYPDIEWVEGRNIIGRIAYTYKGREVGASNLVYDTSQQMARLVGSEPVSDKLEEIAEAEQLAQMEAEQGESDEDDRNGVTPIFLIGGGCVLVILLAGGLVAYKKSRTNRARYRAYQRRMSRKKELHF